MFLKLNIHQIKPFLTLIISFFISFLYAQPHTDNFVYIKKINIEGNIKTKDKIILRELDFMLHDSIAVEELPVRLTRNEFLLMNSGLFSWVKLNIKDWDTTSQQLSIDIDLQEAWFIYPIPILSLADRNFNVWWDDYNHSLRRIDFGCNLYWSNFTGNRDYLRAVFQYGFTQKYELDYTFPFINKKQTLGLNGNILYSRNKELNYQTLDSEQQFYRNDDKFIFRRFRTGFRLTYRPKLLISQSIGVRFQHNIIDEEIAQDLNPNFFLEGKTKQRYFSLFYHYIYENRDIKPYPLHGNYFAASVTKSGLGIFKDRNNLSLAAKYIQYISFSDIISLEWTTKAQTNLIRRLRPFYNNKALGYFDDYIRGYEFYVIDGEDYAYMKSDLRFRLFDGNFNWGKAMFIESLKLMPLKLYFKLNTDVAYVNQPYYQDNNPLSNRVLYGGGVGLDIVVYYDKLVQLNYSINHLGEHGFFLHWKLSF